MIPPPDKVHLWQWPLSPEPGDEALLAPDECARADRFHFASDRTRFLAARAGLRRRLGRVLDRAPETLAFRYGPFGKPSLADEGSHGLDFNLSHSGEVALLAVASGFAVGIDLEAVRALDHDRLASVTFAPAEAAAIRAMSPGDKPGAFFRCWTRKEAYVKALGRGFDLPLASFTVSLAPDEPAALVSVDGAPNEPARWQFARLEPASGYIGAIAARRTGWRWVKRD